MIKYSLIRSRRKTIAIHITKNADVEVRVPLKMSKAEIERFVISKQDWINKYLSAAEQRMEDRAAFSLNYGEKVSLQGNSYPIIAKKGNRVGFDGEQFYIPPDLPSDEVKGAVIQIYRLVAKQVLTKKVTDYANLTGLVPAAVKINSAKTRWGSCSGKKSINFSWRLIMADEDVIDYVVVHELAHIREPNHSARFWGVVASVLPDYKERQERLKSLQKRLASEDWF